jgi:hypothetical protein
MYVFRRKYQHENIKKEGNIKFYIQKSLVQGFTSNLAVR